MTNAPNGGADWWRQHVETELQSKVDKDAYTVWQQSIVTQMAAIVTSVEALRLELKADREKRDRENEKAEADRKALLKWIIGAIIVPVICALLALWAATKGG